MLKGAVKTRKLDRFSLESWNSRSFGIQWKQYLVIGPCLYGATSRPSDIDISQLLRNPLIKPTLTGWHPVCKRFSRYDKDRREREAFPDALIVLLDRGRTLEMKAAYRQNLRFFEVVTDRVETGHRNPAVAARESLLSRTGQAWARAMLAYGRASELQKWAPTNDC